MSSLHWATTTTLVNLHRGSALPAARVVIVLVPSAAFVVYLIVSRRGQRRQ